jgi:hypothetical protein
MGDQFVIDVNYVSLLNPTQHLQVVNDQLEKLKKEGRANILFRALSSLDRNTETGIWYIEGLLAPEDGDIETDPELVANRERGDEIYDCELMLPELDGLLAQALYYDRKNIVTHPRYVPLYQIPDLIGKVKGWSTARGILENGIWYTQATKMYEEDGEVAPGVAKSRRNLIIDGLGDMIVVMVNLMELTSFNSLAISKMVEASRKEAPPTGTAHYLYHKVRLSNSIAVDYLWDVSGIDSPKQLTREMFSEEHTKYVVGYLTECLHAANALANAYEFTLEQALSLAWDEIKDRTGFLNADGVFVKESDMTENDRIQRALKETEKAGDFDGDTGPTIKVELSVAEQLKDYDGDVQSGGVPAKTVEVSYFPVVPTTEQLSAATDAIHATLGEGYVSFTRVGYYYGGDTFYTRPHVLFEYSLDGRAGTRYQLVEENEHWQFADDAASYIVNETVSQ